MITIEQYSALSARFLDSFEGPEFKEAWIPWMEAFHSSRESGRGNDMSSRCKPSYNEATIRSI